MTSLVAGFDQLVLKLMAVQQTAKKTLHLVRPGVRLESQIPAEFWKDILDEDKKYLTSCCALQRLKREISSQGENPVPSFKSSDPLLFVTGSSGILPQSRGSCQA